MKYVADFSGENGPLNKSRNAYSIELKPLPCIRLRMRWEYFENRVKFKLASCSPPKYSILNKIIFVFLNWHYY